MTVTQSERALARANTVRMARAELKRNLREMTQSEAKKRVVALFDDPPDWLQTMLAYDLLMACPRIGSGKVGRLLRGARVERTTRIGALTERQRGALAAYLLDEDEIAA